LAMRLRLRESHLFRKMESEEEKITRGNIFMFFKNGSLAKRYVIVTLMGLPIWAMLATMITFTVEFAKDFGMTELPNTGMAILSQNIGTALGIVGVGMLSQHLHSRKKAITVFMLLGVLSVVVFTGVRADSLSCYYLMCGFLGFGIGYWAMAVQTGTEQFGTNLRATATTSLPNVIRAFAIPATLLFQALIPELGVTMSGAVVVLGAWLIGFIALALTQETFHADLDFLEK